MVTEGFRGVKKSRGITQRGGNHQSSTQFPTWLPYWRWTNDVALLPKRPKAGIAVPTSCDEHAIDKAILFKHLPYFFTTLSFKLVSPLLIGLLYPPLRDLL
jgi:hypothetical protein